MLSTSVAVLPKVSARVLAVLLTAVFGLGVARALAEPEAQPSRHSADANTTAEPSPVDESPVEVDKVLDLLLAAARDARAGMRSAAGKAKFVRWTREPGKEELRQMTSGRLQMYYDEGKYHLSFRHETMLRRTIDLPQGVFPSRKPGEFDVFRNQAGEVVEVPARFADWKPDSTFIVNDGARIRSTIYTPRIHPDGTRSNWHKELMYASEEVAGIGLIDPLDLVGGLDDLETIVQNLGRDAFQVAELPNEGYRATYRLKNAPRVRAELDAFKKDDFNVSAVRVFNEGDKLPATAKEATWKQIDGHWVATKLSAEHRFRGPKFIDYQKDVIIYYELELNGRVDPEAFTYSSMNDKWAPRNSPKGSNE